MNHLAHVRISLRTFTIFFLCSFSWMCSGQKDIELPEFDKTHSSAMEFHSQEPWDMRLLITASGTTEIEEIERLFPEFKKDTDFRMFSLGKDKNTLILETKSAEIRNKIRAKLQKSKFKSIPDKKIHISSINMSDPLIQHQWGLSSIEMPKIWQQQTTMPSKEIKVAVIDSGIEMSHPDIKANIAPGYDFVQGDNSPDDENGHGTHIAGIIAAQNNSTGIVGVAPFAKIMPLKIIDREGNGSLANLLYAINFAVDNGAAVINISSGFYANLENDKDALAMVNEYTLYAFRRGVTIVASAGNRPLQSGEVFYRDSLKT